MYLRLPFNAEGENFQPKKFLKDFVQENIQANYDKNFPHHLTFIHQKEFSQNYWDKAYEQNFYTFIMDNINELMQANATDFSLFIEVYRQIDEQCNFQILDKDFLRLIGNCEIDLPISVYTDS